MMAGIDGGGAGPQVQSGVTYSASTRKVGDLVLDILPRLGATKTGITVYGAVNSITSLIYHKLLERNSELIAVGYYESILPAGSVSVPLPDYFTGFAERPRLSRGESLITGLLAALTAEGVQIANVNAIGAMLAKGALISDLQDLAATDVPSIDVKGIVHGLVTSHRHMEPTFLDDDKDRDHSWYSWYSSNGNEYGGCEKMYKVVNDTVFVRPRQQEDCLISARYFQSPLTVSAPDDVLQYSSLSYDVYREGALLIMVKGLAVPDADPVFNALFEREVMSVVNARARILPTRRMTRRNWI